MNDHSQKFLDELQSLLRKYDVEITADDHWTGYSECGRDVRMTVDFKYPYPDIDLGSFVDGKSHGGKNG